ncbi:TetR family transcriptional regulator [Mycobacterium saskatchewanense]|uniref:TetR family transcriptional regulator n=1 Tax=Mycobacterium saskatchewanense TaxID=220927 RepID=A0AAJ3NN85_9MYCO|nr:TetR family transcriptional regulator [Mycobacterium saskatchewanense]ORW69175.1 TetR family transcriptional regulator [Mycobacterium saskatchewanense]BBX61656.1 TetR family transcriptional regulator [Mycobacterium saskatchewanense]
MRTRTELRGEILAAARAEFAQYGLAGARIDRIARAANASKERLYAHFGDKETLFRDVVSTDGAEFFRAVELHPDAVPEFVGGVFDLAQSRPEHLRMITWAKLEGFPLDKPEFDGEHPPERAIAAVEQAQADGHVDPAWEPQQLLVFLFAIGLAWAHWPDPAAATTDPDVIARRRAAAVEAAARIVEPRPRDT